jgi:type I restriction enzyme M protein
MSEILAKDANLSISRYVRRTAESALNGEDGDLRSTWAAFDASGRDFWQQMDALMDMLDGTIAEEAPDA